MSRKNEMNYISGGFEDKVTKTSYKTYLWQQLPDKIIRSKMLEPSNGRIVEDSDESIDGENELLKQNSDADFYDIAN
jgi:hypothetical protein